MITSRQASGVAAVAVLGAVTWAFLAPAERSLGEGIRMVYLHVGATQAGLLFLYGVGVAGLVAAARPYPRVAGVLRLAWTAGLATFVVGFALSLVSAQVSWGGVFWAEPRVRASLGVVAVGLLALAVGTGPIPVRARSLVWTVAAVLSFVVLRSAALFIHPEQPIRPETPLGIKAAFLGTFACFTLAAGAAVVGMARLPSGPREDAAAENFPVAEPRPGS